MTTSGWHGWMGGTFDPIHLGHLDVAKAAHQALGLTRVTLVPARIPPHRPQPHASTDQRLAMTHLAAASAPWLDVSTIELDADGPSFTAVTLDRLEARGGLQGLVLITGADAFAGVLGWHRPMDVVGRVCCAVVSRPGYSALDLRDVLPSLAGRMRRPDEWRQSPTPEAIVLIDAPTAPVSSTAVRARAARGESLDGLVPPPVAEYISQHALYSRTQDLGRGLGPVE